MSFYPAEPDNAPISPWEKAPLLRVAFCLMAGIGMGWLCREYMPSEGWLGLAGTLGVVGLWFWRKGQKQTARSTAGLCALLTFLTGAAALGQMRYEALYVEFPTEPQLWTAEVVNRHKVYENGLSADVSLNYPTVYKGHHIRLRLAGDSAKRLVPGNRLTFRARLEQPRTSGNPHDFDYRSYLLTHGITGTGFVNSPSWTRLPDAPASGWETRLLQFRQQLTDRYAVFLDHEVFALISALTLGDKTSLDRDTRDLFSDTGTSHVLALSGLHLGILYTLLHFSFLRWFRRRIFFILAHLLTVLALWFFVFLAGAPLSLLRATFMFTLWIGCSCMQRTHGTGLNNWALAAIVLLLCSPLSLLDVGFQLSFAAVLGILLCNDYIWYRHALPDWWDEDEIDKALLYSETDEAAVSRWRRLKIRLKHGLTPPVWKFLKQTIVPFFTVSLSAQIGTLPFILYYFHQFTPYALLANVIVIPAAYLLISCALLFFFIPIPAVQTTIGLCMNGVSRAMMEGLEQMAVWPGATLKCYPALLTLLAAAVFPVLIYALCTQHRKRIRLRLIYAVTLCLATGFFSEVWAWKNRQLSPQLIVYNVPRATLVHFIVSNEESYLYSSVSPDTTEMKVNAIRNNFWKPYKLAEPQRMDRPNFKTQHLLRRNDIFLFGSETLVLLHHQVRPKKGGHPLPVQSLLIQRGCYDSLATIRQVFTPERILLDRSLSTRLRRRWKKECEQAGIPCHDIRNDGAFIQMLSKPNKMPAQQ